MSKERRRARVKGVILIVEDNLDWLRLLRKLCEREGCRVRCAQNVEAALSLLKTLEFDVIVADVRLKDWESDNAAGLDVLGALPESNRPSAIIVTAFPDFGHVRRAFRDYKVTDVVYKGSFDAAVFARTLARAIEQTKRSRGA